MMSGDAHLPSVDRHRFEGAVPQFFHSPFLQLAIMGSNFNFNKELYLKVKKKDLLSVTVTNGSISHQYRRCPSRYRWVHLLSAFVKYDRISHQYRRHLSRYRWIHLLPRMTVSAINLGDIHPDICSLTPYSGQE
jgi:hypothetical protein